MDVDGEEGGGDDFDFYESTEDSLYMLPPPMWKIPRYLKL